jgi:hypothetical protein
MDQIKQRGLGLAAISYDSPAILKSFAERKNITYPLLSDPESRVIRAYDLLNTTIPKGPFFGIPYPGTFILDRTGKVIAKYFEDDYTQRFTTPDILARQYGAPVSAPHSAVAAKHLQISASVGTPVVHMGQRVLLNLDISAPGGVHVYAPGVSGYIPIQLDLTASPAYTLHDAVYPPSKTMRLAAIDETVPVYTGDFRVFREISITKDAKPGDLEIDGSLRYQACDEKQCFVPETVPLKWVVRVESLDRQRAPAEIQHKQ